MYLIIFIILRIFRIFLRITKNVLFCYKIGSEDLRLEGTEAGHGHCADPFNCNRHLKSKIIENKIIKIKRTYFYLFDLITFNKAIFITSNIV